MFRKTIRTATIAFAALAAMTMIAQESSAQCGGYGGGGFNRGVGGISVSVGRSNFGGFNNGFRGGSFNSFNSFGRSSFNSGFRGGSFYSPSRSFGHGGFNSFGRSGFRY